MIRKTYYLFKFCNAKSFIFDLGYNHQLWTKMRYQFAAKQKNSKSIQYHQKNIFENKLKDAKNQYNYNNRQHNPFYIHFDEKSTSFDLFLKIQVKFNKLYKKVHIIKIQNEEDSKDPHILIGLNQNQFPPEDNIANTQIQSYLTCIFGSSCIIQNGLKSKRKVVKTNIKSLINDHKINSGQKYQEIIKRIKTSLQENIL